jgi:superfamily II DNA/RNA helicase
MADLLPSSLPSSLPSNVDSLNLDALNFDTLGLSAALQRSLAEQGLASPTPIQAQAIPAVLQGRDVWASAPTGSGKTLAFALPLVQLLQPQPGQYHSGRATRALVLVPTRELAVQIGQVLSALAWPLGLKVAVVYGGVSINPQMMGLRGGADVLVATPGRLLDLVAHNAVQLGQLKHLVLDEADRLLDAGFADELQRVLALLPAQRQTLLFSATFDAAVAALAQGLLHEPLRLSVQAENAEQAEQSEQASPPAAIEQRAMAVDEAKRLALLRHLIATHAWPRVLVFVATRYACEHVAGKLFKAGIQATAFHGDMSQGGRQNVLAAFKAGRLQVVVTTDLASRGIDIALLPVVLNYDLPRSATDYTHRIGRTGRAGAQGLALSFVTAHAQAHWQLICKRTDLQLPLEVVPGFEPLDTPPALMPGGGGIKGKRPSKKDKLRAMAPPSQP